MASRRESDRVCSLRGAYFAELLNQFPINMFAKDPFCASSAIWIWQTFSWHSCSSRQWPSGSSRRSWRTCSLKRLRTGTMPVKRRKNQDVNCTFFKRLASNLYTQDYTYLFPFRVLDREKSCPSWTGWFQTAP